jgi:hypothetical protein
MERYLPIGGLVAVGFDPTGMYLLTITHSGRGVFTTESWARLARDTRLAYPEAGVGIGIGPIEGERVLVEEMPFEIGYFSVISPDGRIKLKCESEGISITVSDDE